MAARRGLGAPVMVKASTASTPSPERARLAECIERRDRFEAEAATLAAAVEPARRAMAEAMDAVDAAKAAVQTATQAAATHAIAALAGETITAPPDAETARVQLRRAQDRLDAAHATRVEVDRRGKAVRDRLSGLEVAVESAVLALVFAETRAQRDALARRIEVLQVEFIDATAAMSLLLFGRPRPLLDEDRAHDSAARQAEVAPFSWGVADGPMAAKLRAWRAALMTDAMAEAPDA
jgi:hypothetical protein